MKFTFQFLMKIKSSSNFVDLSYNSNMFIHQNNNFIYQALINMQITKLVRMVKKFCSINRKSYTTMLIKKNLGHRVLCDFSDL